MSLLLSVLVYLPQTIQATSTNLTNSSHPQPSSDGTTRSVWSILGSCAVTMLICVWRAIHFDLSGSPTRTSMQPVILVLSSFFVPEIVVMAASAQWWEARDKVTRFHRKGYGWSMTHSFFAEMGGFVYRDENGGTRTVKSLEFLELCEANKIANPLITAKEIKDKSKSDALGKVIFTLQLLWFTLQVVVRGSHGLAITLVELDTVSMAALTLLVLWFWWEKPLRLKCPHILYYSPPGMELYPRTESVLKEAWKAEPSYLRKLMARFTRKSRSNGDEEETALVGKDEKVDHPTSSVEQTDNWAVEASSFFASWMVLGVIHLIAWNFDFPTETEKILWRVGSLVLAAGPLVSFVCGIILWGFVACLNLNEDLVAGFLGGFVVFACILGVISRTLLIALILASLRALPPSAHQTVSWTEYIPHL